MDYFSKTDADKWYERNKHILCNEGVGVIVDKILSTSTGFIGEKTKLLEVGCGDGSRLDRLQKHFDCSAVGVDLSPKAIKLGQKKYPNISLRTSDAKHLPFIDSSFNFVHLGFMLYLVHRSDYLRVLSEADRVLDQGGYLAILDFDVPCPYSNIYAPNPTLKSYKMDNSRVFTASGLYTLVSKTTFQHENDQIGSVIDNRISYQLLKKENVF